MNAAIFFVSMLVWLQFKHFVADYLLQPSWMLRGKGDVSKPGGYVHAALHACGSLPVYFFASLGGWQILLLAVIEFVIHYAIDYAKAVHGQRWPHAVSTKTFWALHGADQLLHHLTYSGLLLYTLLNSPVSLSH